MPYAAAPSGARYHYELYGDGDEKVLFVGGFACCKGYWKPAVANLLNKGRAAAAEQQQDSGSIAPSHSASPPSSLSSPPSPSPSSSSPLSLSTEASGPTPRNRYQICIFDARGFGQSGIGGLSAFSTSNMAIDTLALLAHLGWITPASGSPYLSFLPASSSSSAAAPPVLHVVSWSLGGMISQELSFLLLSPASRVSHSLTSLVFTSSSPGGYREPDEPAVSYFLRNQPPWDGFKLILGILFLSLTNAARISWVLRLHFSDEYLNRPYEGVWPLQEEEECFCTEGCEKAAVRAMSRMAKQEEKREAQKQGEDSGSSGSGQAQLPSPSSSPPSGRPLLNRDVLAQVYASRSPFDRNVVYYLYGLAHHVVAVYTHAFSRDRFHQLHLYNTVTTHSAQQSKTVTRTSAALSIPSTLPGPQAATVRERRVTPLVLTGDRDLLISPQNSLTLAKYLRCAAVIVKNSGHMMYVEHPNLFANIIHKHFTMAKASRTVQQQHASSSPSSAVWHEDDMVKVVDYTRSNHPDRHRRLSTISASLSSSSPAETAKPSLLSSLSSLRSLLTVFFFFKLVSSLPQLRLLRGRMIGSFSEVVRPLVLLHQHLRSLLMHHLRSLLSVLRTAL